MNSHLTRQYPFLDILRTVLPQLGAGGGDVRQANLWEGQGQVREAHEDRPWRCHVGISLVLYEGIGIHTQ